MAQEIADSKLLDTWGSSGTKIEPDISKIIEGWQLGEQPPHEYMNWLQNTFGSKLNHILKNGVAEWNNETEYLAGATAQHSGSVWLCKTTNTNSEPTELNANWERLAINKDLTVTVDTLADLRSISYPANTVWASGYHTKNDGAFGSHIFRLKGVKTTETDNSGTVIIATIGGTDYVYELQFDGAVNVKWFGAKGDGITDDTASFNKATEYNIQYTSNGVFSNNSARKKDILVPSTEFSYKLNGTVYVRKGQHLRGFGLGPARITIPVTTGGKTFKLGYGLINGIEVADEGGLPPSVSYLATEGGHTDGAVIEAIGVAGASINNLFITTASIGIYGAGGDIAITNTTFDDGGVGISLEGSRNSIIACHFFNNSIGIDIRSNSYDWIINGNTFGYSLFNDIIFNGTTGLVRDIIISNNKFLMNGQYVTNGGSIRIQTGNPKIAISDCIFSNLYSWAIIQSTAENIECSVSDCTFNGEKSHSVYTQSTTSRGIRVGNGQWVVSNNKFKNLHSTLIQVSTTVSSNAIVEISNNTIFENSSTSAFVTIDTIGKEVIIKDNIRLSGVTTLINSTYAYTSTTPNITLAKNNNFWDIVDNGTRKYIKIPSINYSSFLLRCTYNGATSGAAAYRRSKIIAIEKGTSFNGAVVDYVSNNTLTSSTLVGTIPPAMDVQVELDNVGAGSTLPTTVNKYRDIVISIPSTNTGYVNFELL